MKKVLEQRRKILEEEELFHAQKAKQKMNPEKQLENIAEGNEDDDILF